MSPAPLIAVVGATATGKSDLAVELALRLGGEVVNADAMQLYRGMDIGTAKLSAAERRGIPHHLLDVLDVREEASVAAYQRETTRLLDDLARRGTRVILAGGSGLYVRAALDELEIPPTDRQLRRALEGELAEVGAAVLHARLAGTDPAAAAAILPSNGRRIVRALEVVRLTGRPFSATLPTGRYRRPAIQLGLAAPRPELDARIGARVDRMWAQGLVAETGELAARGLREGRTASRALGYAQILDHLAGHGSQREAQERTVLATRQFARRQEKWFRRDERISWLPYDAPDLLEQALRRLGR